MNVEIIFDRGPRPGYPVHIGIEGKSSTEMRRTVGDDPISPENRWALEPEITNARGTRLRGAAIGVGRLDAGP